MLVFTIPMTVCVDTIVSIISLASVDPLNC